MSRKQLSVGTVVRSIIQAAFGWARPSWRAEATLTEAVWKTQHDEISKTIWRLASLLVAASVFCIIILGSPDVSLISNDAKISVPIASITISYSDFLLFGPIFLIGLSMYLHVFIEQRLRLIASRPQSSSPDGNVLSPFLFNLGRPSANFLSAFLFYGLAPCVLAFFIWKTLPRPVAPWLLSFAFIAFSAFMLGLRIRRFAVENRDPNTRGAKIRQIILWTLLGACVVFLFVLTPITERIIVDETATRQEDPASAIASSPRGKFANSAIFRIRRLQLFGAPLDKKNLSGFYAPYADLRKADFHETDLEGANLTSADLRKANLTNVNLTGADLTYARLDGADLRGARLDRANLRHVVIDDETKIDDKWRRVTCILNADLSRDCLKTPDLTWADLKGANLNEASLRGVQLTGADLSYADLSTTDLAGAVLRVADLRHSILPASIQNAIVDGALMSSNSALANSDNLEALIFLKNRTTEACIEAPAVPEDFTPAMASFPCSQENNRERWNVKRLPNGMFMLKGATRGTSGQSACLDGTSANNDFAEIQMWQCNVDYDNQHWRIVPVFDGFVQIQKNTTGMCLHGTGSREGRRVPFLSTCNSEKHDQHWLVSTSVASPSTSGVPAVLSESVRQQRAHDLESAARQYKVSPAGSPYGYGRGFESRPYLRQNRSVYSQRGVRR